MANCQFNQYKGSIPVGVITTLDNKIIVANVPFNQYDVTKYYKGHGEWLFSGARAMITRFWSCSTATVVIVPHMPSIYTSCPPLPPELGIEKEFCLWLGYIDEIRRVQPPDLEDGKLLRVFIGVVDNIKSTASAQGGYTIQIQARDRMKWFMDSEVYYSVHEITKVFKTTIDNSGGTGIKRSALIHDIARRSIGAPPTESAGFPAEAYGATREITLDPDSEDIGDPTLPELSPYKFYRNGKLRSKTKTTEPVTLNPKISVITTRIPIGGEYDQSVNVGSSPQAGLSFLLSGQIPLDIIKSIAFQEVYPTEFFQDSRDGNFYYVPRTNDATGLQDAERNYRTYFFKINGKEQLGFNAVDSDYLDSLNAPPVEGLNVTQEQLNVQPDVLYPQQNVKDYSEILPKGYVIKKFTVRSNLGREPAKTATFFVRKDTALNETEQRAKALEAYSAAPVTPPTTQPTTPPQDASGVVNTIEINRTNLTVSAEITPVYLSTAQDLVAYREEFSSIGMKTNFFISISSPLTSITPHSDMVMHLATNPYSLRGVDYVPKFHRINDPTLKTAEEAAVVALSAARIWAKETNVAMAVMLGDPSLVPGEVIQVLGSPILEEGGVPRLQADREKYFEWEVNTDRMIKSYAKFSSSVAIERAKNNGNLPEAEDTEFLVKKGNAPGEYIGEFYDNSEVDIRIGNKEYKGSFLNIFDNRSTGGDDELTGDVEALLSTGKSIHYGANNSILKETKERDPNGTRGFEELPRTIYRAEAVHHKMNLGNPGYTTEVALVSAF